MDDLTLNKIKNFNHLFLFYKTFFLFGFALLFILGLSIKSSFYSEKSYLQSFIDNWDKKPIIDVKLVKQNNTDLNFREIKNQIHNISLCPEGYELNDLAKFPVAETLCDCSESYLYDLSYGAIKSNKCNKFQYMIGCKDFHGIENLKFSLWKDNYICVKRHNLSYLELKRNLVNFDNNNNEGLNNEKIEKSSINFNNENNRTKCCSSKDTNIEDICADVCPIRNIDLFAKFEIFKNKSNKYSTRKKFARKGIKHRNYLKAEEKQKENFTTYNDLEKFYKKNFKKNEKSQRLKNLAISDIIITDNFPCLVTENFKPSNVLYGLLNFFLHNFQYFKFNNYKRDNKKIYFERRYIEEEKTDNENESLRSFLKTDENKNYDFDRFVEFENVPEEKCVFYQNAYYDRRLFTLDEITYVDFLTAKWNSSDFNFYNKLNISEKPKSGLNAEESRKIDLNSDVDKFVNGTFVKNGFNQISNGEELNYVYLISKPFFGWSKQFCKNDPQLQLEVILNLFQKSNIYVDFLLLLKVISFIYIVFIFLMQKLKIEFENGFYVGTNNCDRKMFIIVDFLYFFINLMSLFNAIYLAINLKTINKYNYLKLINDNCLDDQSSRIIGYLSDSCEESIIYCFLLMSVISIDIILYSIVIMKSYTIKSNLVSD